MPPFLGTAAEAGQIADYLYQQIDKRPLHEIYGLQGPPLGRKVYDIHCAKCHILDGPTDKSKSFAGQSADDLGGMLDMLPDLAPAMPAYSDGPAERAALIAFLQQLGQQVKR